MSNSPAEPCRFAADDRRLGGIGWLAAALLLLAGLFLRGWDLSATALWVDEAESAINALTILDHGVPVDTYMGLPIYENILTEPWPSHPEYEYRDSSYSDRGVAIYHGWLPLYSIAASHLAFGVEPDRDPTVRSVQHDASEINRRILSARAPAVFYGGLFLVLMFVTARSMYGNDAAFAALAFGALAEPFITAARQARYYAPTLALSVACCLATWQMFKRGRWLDFLLAGVAFGLLFHTHILSFVILCVAATLALPRVLMRPGGWVKSAAFAAVVTAMVLPWVLLTGFLNQASTVPPARALLDLPADLLAYPLRRPEFVAAAVISVAWLAVVSVFHRLLPQRLVTPVRGHGFVIIYLVAWGVVALAAFTLLVPAASYFIKRLILSVMGPGALLLAVFAAMAARAAWPRASQWLAPAGVAALLVVGGFLPTHWPWHSRQNQDELLAFLRDEQFPVATRFYATPNDHLTLQYLTGMPFQSVAPVRREFLAQYPGAIVVVEPVVPYVGYPAADVAAVAAVRGVTLSDAEAQAWAERLQNALVRRESQARFARVSPPPELLPAWAEALLDEQRAITARLMTGGWNPERENAAVFRGQEMTHWGQWWPVFFYRFVDWPSRTDANLNYAARARTGTGHVLQSGWVVVRAPALEAAGASP